MRVKIILFICCVFLISFNAFGVDKQNAHFEIKNVSEPNYIQHIQANAEAYYQVLRNNYFLQTWDVPLTIYYSNSEAETEQLIYKNGHKEEAAGGYYIPSVPAIYVNRFRDNKDAAGWSPVFHQIARHFIEVNYPSLPEWVKKELAEFLGERTRIVQNKLVAGPLDTRCQTVLNAEVEEKGAKVVSDSLRMLVLPSTKRFENWECGPAFASVFFNWLFNSGKLKPFLDNAQNNGYNLQNLEDTMGKRYGDIKTEFMDFIKDKCSGAAHLEAAKNAPDATTKQQELTKALEMNPLNPTARLELAKIFYGEEDYQSCRENLEQLLAEPANFEFLPAAWLMGNSCYKQMSYSKALEFYNKTWEYAANYEYKHRVAYQIANCYYFLNNKKNAKQWYGTFLNTRWKSEQMVPHAEYARKFIAIRK